MTTRLAPEYRSLHKVAKRHGWTVTRRARHLEWRPPHGAGWVITSLTPSDHRSWKNDRAALRRAGLPIPH